MNNEAILTEHSPARRRQSSNVSQNEIIRKNVSALTEGQRKEDAARTLAVRFSDWITAFSGSMFFVVIHAVWFGLWILLNVGLVHIPHVSEFDPFPFGLLTMIVSLEAIFLSTFVLVSQNRQAKLSEKRAELDLHVNLLAEQKATKVLEMLDQISTRLNQSGHFQQPRDPEVEALKVSPEPQEVLQVLKSSVEQEAKEVKQQVGEAVEDISGEVEAVRGDVREVKGDVKEIKEEVGEDVERVEDKVEDVARDVKEIKAQTGEHARATFD